MAVLSWGETRALAIERAVAELRHLAPARSFALVDATMIKGRTRRVELPPGGSLDRVLRATTAAIDAGSVTRRGPGGDPYVNLNGIMKRRGANSGLTKPRVADALRALETLGLVDHLPATGRRSAAWRPRPATADTLVVKDRSELPYVGPPARVEARWALMYEPKKPASLEPADVFVPHPDAPPEWAREAAGLVGHLPESSERGHVLLHFQEDTGGDPTLARWANRVAHAHGRMVEGYPTHRQLAVSPSWLIRVGRYDPLEGSVDLDGDDAIVTLVCAWLGGLDPEHLDAELRTTWTSHERRRRVRSAVAERPRSAQRRLDIIDEAHRARCADLIPEAWLS